MWDLHRDVLRRSLDARGWAYLELGADMDRRRMREAMRAVADGLSRTEQQLHARARRDAKPDDVLEFVDWERIQRDWPRMAPHLGRQREFWAWWLEKVGRAVDAE